MNMYQGSGYNADIIMCIDSTGSMKPCLDNVKRQALSFYPDFINAMEESGKKVDKLRIKVIDFRDYGDTKAPAMTESRYFNFGCDEDDSAAFSEHINSIEPLYGGDVPFCEAYGQHRPSYQQYHVCGVQSCRGSGQFYL